MSISHYLTSGESDDALDAHEIFMKEAENYYRQAGRKKKIVHLIDGFEIEVSCTYGKLPMNS